MANIAFTTSLVAAEALTLASITSLFEEFLSSLPALIEDEKDLSGYLGCDPAVDAWIIAADASRAVTLEYCTRMLSLCAFGPQEQSLQRVARLFKATMLTESPDLVTRLRNHATTRQWAYLVSPGTTGALQYNAMIVTALCAFEAYLSIEDGVVDTLVDPQGYEGHMRDSGTTDGPTV